MSALHTQDFSFGDCAALKSVRNEKPPEVVSHPRVLIESYRQVQVDRHHLSVSIGLQGRRPGNVRVRHVTTRGQSMELGN